ncbi:4-hydroxythreonine-4-phosphate dehydrogenase PdxA [Desulfoglaeba alkanexedens]|uniref:4-hydroxythreonine-4-phosphate dehydrogenase n=1 Tax=Desulfoglaeba alkanexedens ALDC TaxID=980445 RepID=A0A4V1ERP3_9BACT|nr:4-hydroxythreonine-4-phosphate dehydrogenase PdxA [Desulfoglaeba alkanexedens]QCQ22341.1 4-hydroxythreonine-4-phosphate dehydrogenase PdxA [Desulfoglaeba alkanexedens ALDC]
MHDPPSTGRPKIAVTVGDPTGVGPEIVCRAVMRPQVFQHAMPLIVGDAMAMERAWNLLSSNAGRGPRPPWVQASERDPWGVPPGSVPLLSPVPLHLEDIPYGDPSEKAARSVIRNIEAAVSLALQRQVDAVVTGPIHKGRLHRSGFLFPGHTEFLKHLTGARTVVMMLAGPKLRVSLATIHCALRQVPELLTAEGLADTIRITGEALIRDFGLAAPRLAVCGLNPHAGEEGAFGREEIELIRPVVERFEKESFRVSGPHPADTLFWRAFHGEFDAVVALYHDQGLIPVKLVHFDRAVNVSLGLPIIRTSVDHGTAYDIAGTGKADASSLLEAIAVAALMARNRRAAEAG